ncbi:hypothetical protein KR215_006041 [Drosophila sulfurigaster]|nr:hypothetical protein KR215_006041 [Drosophila sulfurigaster]
MVKKRQTDAQQDGNSSTDSGASGAAVCQHIKRAVDTTRLRRQLKATGLLYECVQCQKLNATNVAGSSGNGGVDGSGESSATCEADNTLWLCLNCGTQLCGRERNTHALQHHQTPRSDSHALVLNTRSFKIWCYDCRSEVSPNSRKNLLECVELVKRLAQKPPTSVANAEAEQPTISNIEYKMKSTLEQLSAMVPMTGGQLSQPVAGAAIPLPPPPPPAPAAGVVPGMAKRMTGNNRLVNIPKSVSPQLQTTTSASNELDRLPRVRGLTNLGNTCFFNAVMQCLAQTPFLLAVLKELGEPGEQFVLPGGTFSFADSGDVELPMIKGTLSSWGTLTSALANALEELQCVGGVLKPSKLFDKLCAKCPQFMGGDQHDAHELLRQMLESVRSEDLKRYQRVILETMGYKNQNVNDVSQELRQKCKIYGNQAADRILRPEQVFRGFLVSTLTCQDCYNISSRHEYFLDMSLPVAVEKPQPPQRRKVSPENSPMAPNAINANFTNGETDVPFAKPATFYLHQDGQEPLGPSKAQVKKDKERERKAKRAAKHQRTKQAQKLSLKLNVNDENNASAGGGDADADVDQQPGSGDNQAQPQSPGSADVDTDIEKTRSASWGEGPRVDSFSGTTSEHSDADVEDNLVEDTAADVGAGVAAAAATTKFYTDTNGNAQPLSEKRDDTPENMDKDSLEEDENDSGIATSPAPTTTTSISASAANSTTNSTTNSNNAVDGEGDKDKKQHESEGSTGAVLVNAGLSEVGASLIRQISSGQLQIDQLKQQMGNLKLRDGTQAQGTAAATGAGKSVAAAAAAARSKRVRTQSCSDWSTTIAPRYQCEADECSVQSCLNNFTAVELMTGQNKVGCESCTRRINGDAPDAKSVNTNATKQLLVSSPPAVLILHLKRFQLGPRCVFRKVTRQVSYSTLLDIAAFCGSKVKNLPNIDRKQKKLLYALYGVVEHSGGLYGGHYTAYVKVRPKLTADDKRWKFLPHGSKAELDQDDELEQLLAKEKAREMRMNAMDDSDDFSNSSSNVSTSTEHSVDHASGLENGDDDAVSASGDQAAESGTTVNGKEGASPAAATAEDEAANVQAPPGKWYYVSDSRVQEVSEEAALKAQAYLLFYERIY